MPKVGKLLTEWDESELVENEIKYQLEDNEEGLTEEEIERDVYNDGELLNICFDGFAEHLTEILRKKNKDGFWRVTVSNFGWRNTNGEKAIRIDNAQELIRQILPDTDCTFKIYNYSKGLVIQNFHHDSPVGKEWYYLTPIKESTYEKIN